MKEKISMGEGLMFMLKQVIVMDFASERLEIKKKSDIKKPLIILRL
jgi:hypothetical protein